MTATTMAHNVDRLSSAKEERKLRKPLIERKRRERINNCLDQLKETVVGAFRLDQSKLEKADILEMTVKHLQNIQNNRMMDSTVGLEAQQRYSTGYIQCMHEVHNLLLTCEWMDKTLGARLLNHLLKSLPRSNEETSKAALKSPTSAALSPSLPLAAGVLSPTPQSPHSSNNHEVKSSKDGTTENREPPRSRGHHGDVSFNSNHLASLDMWRPW